MTILEPTLFYEAYSYKFCDDFDFCDYFNTNYSRGDLFLTFLKVGSFQIITIS